MNESTNNIMSKTVPFIAKGGRTLKSAIVLASFILMTLGFSLPAHSGTLANESGKNWSFKLETRYAYDDNVVQVPTRMSLRPVLRDGADDHLYEWSASGRFKHAFNNKFSIRADYDIDMTIHSDLSQYDLTSHLVGIRPRYKFTKLMNVELTYKYIYNIVDGENFSGIHYFEPSFNYMNKKFGLTRLFYTYKYSDNWLNDLRDNDQHSLGITQYSNFTKRISVGYKYSNDNSIGSSFDRDIHIISVRGKMPLFYGIDMDAVAQFSFRNYDHRIATNGDLRDDTQNKAFVTFSKVVLEKFGFLQKLTAKFKYRYIFNESNLLIREYRTNRYDAVLEARF